MDISDKNATLPINSYVQQVQPKQTESQKNPGATPDTTGPVEDNVDLSQAARELQNTQKLMESIPDVRQDKVDRLKNQIESGTYRVDAGKIADKMVKESLINELLS